MIGMADAPIDPSQQSRCSLDERLTQVLVLASRPAGPRVAPCPPIASCSGQITPRFAQMGLCYSHIAPRSGRTGLRAAQKAPRSGQIGRCSAGIAPRSGQIGSCSALKAPRSNQTAR